MKEVSAQSFRIVPPTLGPPKLGLSLDMGVSVLHPTKPSCLSLQFSKHTYIFAHRRRGEGRNYTLGGRVRHSFVRQMAFCVSDGFVRR